jgi:hypothetical protein
MSRAGVLDGTRANGACVENVATITGHEPVDWESGKDSAAVTTCTPPSADVETWRGGAENFGSSARRCVDRPQFLG